MRSMPLSIAVSPTSISHSNHRHLHVYGCSSKLSSSAFHLQKHPHVCFLSSRVSRSFSPSSKSGICQASQIVELFPAVSPDIVVREARVEDFWEVAETHCSTFYPGYSFPWDFALRINRLLGMYLGFSVPAGCQKACLVAVTGGSMDETFCFGVQKPQDLKIGAFDGKFSLNKGYVAGILTVDTMADFLPKKGPFNQRRTQIAYISNVAVRERYRRKGIAKRLVARAEALARTWGCRSVALHCDLNNTSATKLYKGLGFRCINIPEGASWPQPRASPDTKFSFMMKLLNGK